MKQWVSLGKDLCEFIWARKLWWMIPLFTVLFLFGCLVFMAQGSAVAPFIYVLF